MLQPTLTVDQHKQLSHERKSKEQNKAKLNENTVTNQKAPQGGCGHRRQHARLR